jgi:hypothetical protein
MTEKTPKVGPIRKWREKRDDKRARTGPSADAQQERRNTEKVFDPAAVDMNAGKLFPPS